MKKALLIAALSLSVSVSSNAFAEDGHSGAVSAAASKSHAPHWGYVGSDAAHRWGDLAAEFEACKKGVQQSPINIDQIVQEALPPLNGSFNKTPLEVVNNGHTVQVNYAPGSGFSAYNKDFALLQFHFHTPSEHYVDGAPYPMEVHFVHKATDGTLGVIGVMMKVGAHNPVIEGIWQNVPVAGATKKVDGVSITASDLMPTSQSYYKYDGSLTTPPCSEGVKWHVMKEPIEISADQLKAFMAVFPVNARPIQPISGRLILGD